jgi:hypothetical protein
MIELRFYLYLRVWAFNLLLNILLYNLIFDSNGMMVLFKIKKVVLALNVFHTNILLLVAGSILSLIHWKTRLVVSLASVLQL